MQDPSVNNPSVTGGGILQGSMDQLMPLKDISNLAHGAMVQNQLYKLNQAFQRGGEERETAIRNLQIYMPNIRIAQRCCVENMNKHQAYAILVYQIYGVGATILTYFLAVEERVLWAEQALEALKAHPNLEVESGVISSLWYAYYSMGNMERAGELCTRGLEIAGQLGNEEHWITSQINLGMVRTVQGELEEAVGLYESAYQKMHENAWDDGKGALLNAMGVAYKDLKEYEKSHHYFLQALSSADPQVDTDLFLNLHLNACDVCLTMGNILQAKTHLESTIKWIGEVSLETKLLFFVRLAFVYQAEGKKNQARKCLEFVQPLYKRMGHIRHFLTISNQLIELYQSIAKDPSLSTDHEDYIYGKLYEQHSEIGNYPQAVDCLKKLKQFQGGDLGANFRLLINLGNCLIKAKQFTESQEVLLEAKKILRKLIAGTHWKMNYQVEKVALYESIGLSYRHLQHPKAALRNYLWAHQIAPRDSDDLDSLSQLESNLALVLADMGDFGEAFKWIANAEDHLQDAMKNRGGYSSQQIPKFALSDSLLSRQDDEDFEPPFALPKAQTANDLNETAAILAFNRAYIHRLKGDLAIAVEMATKALATLSLYKSQHEKDLEQQLHAWKEDGIHNE